MRRTSHNFFIIINMASSLTRNSGICVIYQKNAFSAEQMSLVKKIVKKYIDDMGLRRDRNNFHFLEILGPLAHKPRDDYQKLKCMSQCANIFVTHLDSTVCQYLQELFFTRHPSNVLIASNSTAISLGATDNLLRFQSSDSNITRVFLFLIRAALANCVIVYQRGVYYEDLTESIYEAVTATGLKVLKILRENFDLQVIADFVDPAFNIVFILDNPLTYIQQIRADSFFDNYVFQILISDAGVEQLTDDPEFIAYLQQHSTQLIQYFINPQQASIAKQYQAYINNPLHPVSRNVAFLLACIDWAVLISNTDNSHRITRKDYLNLYLDAKNDNMAAIYGGYVYVPGDLTLRNFYFVYAGVLYFGFQIAGGSNSVVEFTPSTSSSSCQSCCFCHNVGICVLYDINGYAAERSFEVSKIIDKYIKDTGTKIRRNRLVFAEITGDSHTDAVTLTKIKPMAKTFVSALGTGRCNYLAQTFFNNNLDCLHLNSYSTAASLSLLPNLGRYQTPDVQIVDVYFYEIRQVPGNCVIVYSGGIYSTELSAEIYAVTNGSGLPTLRILQQDLTPEILDAFTTDYFTIVYILDLVLPEIQKLQNDPVINRKHFQILVSDSAAQNLPTDPNLLTYMQKHDARLIQTFISDRQLALAADFEAAVHNSEHPVSSIVSLFLTCFDWAILVTNTTDAKRLTRQDYLDIYLDKFLDNMVNIYSVYSYVSEGLKPGRFFFLYEGILYVGIKTPPV